MHMSLKVGLMDSERMRPKLRVLGLSCGCIPEPYHVATPINLSHDDCLATGEERYGPLEIIVFRCVFQDMLLCPGCQISYSRRAAISRI
jgi:hypothetical protein